MRCRVCGCADHSACVDRETGETCAWAQPELCTFCAEAEQSRVQVYSEGEASAYIRAMRAGAEL
ncbi:MAG TPA: hypothetical protein VG273_16345 [Bryobacteraceae bacterium]|jgi:hypothetical protein|nr:hypothetical protein [Bryobacteraceae bacterium]